MLTLRRIFAVLTVLVLATVSASAQSVSASGSIPTLLTDKIVTPKALIGTSDSSLTPDLSVSNMYVETALANPITVNAPTNPTHNGQTLTFRFLDNGTGRGITWNAIFRGSPTTTTTASTLLYILFVYNSTDTKWDVLADSGSTGAGAGTVTTTGSPASGNLTQFSGGTSITSGDLSGDCATSGTLATTCTTAGGITIVTTMGTQTVTNKRVTKRTTTGGGACDTASGSTITPNGDSCDVYRITALATNPTVAAPSGTPTMGQLLMLEFKDDGTGRTLTFNAIYRASSDLTLPSTTTASQKMRLLFYYDSADSKWDLMALLDNIS